MSIGKAIVVAREARGDLGLALDAAIGDLLDIVEGRAGIPVTVAALPKGFAGVMRRDHARVDIFINGTHAPARQRFTLAHEFGHYRLGHATVYDTADDIHGRDPQEMQANAFAGEFLVPRAATDAWLEREGDPKVGLETVVRMARHFGVSADAARIRLEQAGRLRGQAKAQITSAIAAGEHKRMLYMLSIGDFHDSLSAIGADDLPRLPATAQRQIKVIYGAGLASIEQIAERTARSVDTVTAELAGVEVAADDPDF